MRDNLINKLDTIRAISSGSKFRRISKNPLKYILAIGHRELIYPLTRRPLIRSANLCWGCQLEIALPSGVDMYILGAKADHSEIRLTKYITNVLKEGDVFVDVGAHFGYYANLAAHLVGQNGRVVACEPSSNAFKLLDKNTNHKPSIEIHKSLIGSKSETVSFYEFPTKYAEYNSIDINQYRNMDWFDESLVTLSEQESISLDDLVNGNKVDFIKIDVEGSEYQVLLGATKVIESSSPRIAIEYVDSNRSNSAHKAAVDLLRSYGYQSNVISNLGTLENIDNLDQSLSDRNVESDNFIFTK